MAQQSSSFIELEQLGTVALIGLALIPGTIFVAKAPTSLRMALRAALVGGAIIGLIALEARMDETANKVTEAL